MDMKSERSREIDKYQNFFTIECIKEMDDSLYSLQFADEERYVPYALPIRDPLKLSFSAINRYEQKRVSPADIKYRLCYECGEVIDSGNYNQHLIIHEVVHIAHRIQMFEMSEALKRQQLVDKFAEVNNFSFYLILKELINFRVVPIIRKMFLTTPSRHAVRSLWMWMPMKKLTLFHSNTRRKIPTVPMVCCVIYERLTYPYPYFI
jgi:hypothetical protein